MSSFQQNEAPVDSESANGGGGAVPEGGGQLSSGGGSEIVVVVVESNGKDERRESSVSECSVEMVDLEIGALEKSKVVSGRTMIRDCRICYLSLDMTSSQDSGIPIELGCSCKDDLAAAHKQCAEAWFKIKGNKICEICGSIAQNVVGVNESEFVEQQWNETNDANATATSSAPTPPTRNFWQGHKFLNFLLACMVFAFVISWLFHFNVPA